MITSLNTEVPIDVYSQNFPRYQKAPTRCNVVWKPPAMPTAATRILILEGYLYRGNVRVRGIWWAIVAWSHMYGASYLNDIVKATLVMVGDTPQEFDSTFMGATATAFAMNQVLTDFHGYVTQYSRDH